jgi:hypothetical protein
VEAVSPEYRVQWDCGVSQFGVAGGAAGAAVFCRSGSAGGGKVRKGRKACFFEKKKQKTFPCLARATTERPGSNG